MGSERAHLLLGSSVVALGLLFSSVAPAVARVDAGNPLPRLTRSLTATRSGQTKPAAPPAVPVGWTLIATDHNTGFAGVDSDPKKPRAIEIRVLGAVSDGVLTIGCTGVANVTRPVKRAGLYTLPVKNQHADDCVLVGQVWGKGRITVQVLVKYQASSPTPPPTTTTTTTTTPAPTSSAYQVSACWTQYTGGSWSAVNKPVPVATYDASDILARGPTNFWTVLTLSDFTKTTLSGVTVSLVEPSGKTFAKTTLDWPASEYRYADKFDWAFTDGSLFFQKPSVTGQGTWTFHWSFPDGETCDAAFSVTLSPTSTPTPTPTPASPDCVRSNAGSSGGWNYYKYVDFTSTAPCYGHWNITLGPGCQFYLDGAPYSTGPQNIWNIVEWAQGNGGAIAYLNDRHVLEYTCVANLASYPQTSLNATDWR